MKGAWIVSLLLVGLVSGCLLTGCAAKVASTDTIAEKAEVRTASPELDVGLLEEAFKEVLAKVEIVTRADLSAALISMNDESVRQTETKQDALVASSKVDNSTSDKWVNRLLAMGAILPVMILCGMLGYPLSRAIRLRKQQPLQKTT